jgi:hypothetical protein
MVQVKVNVSKLIVRKSNVFLLKSNAIVLFPAVLDCVVDADDDEAERQTHTD